MLSDGSVTFEEVEQAIALTVACVEDRGYSVETIPAAGLRHTDYRVFAGDADGVPDSETVGAAQRDAADCSAEFLTPVTDARTAQEDEPSTQQLSSLYDWLEECVESGGVGGRELPSSGTFRLYENAPERSIVVSEEEFETYAGCASQAEEDLGLQAPPPDGWMAIQ